MPVTKHPIAGNVSWSYGSKGSLVLPSSWVSANIGTVYIPQLDGVPTYGGKFSGNVRFYKRAIPQLKAAFAEVERSGLKDKILFWDGSFVPRLKRGGSTPSNHTFGTAFDINAQWNGFKQKPAAKGKKGDLHAVAQIFKRFGFTWGGTWQRTPDGMHFEVNRILSADEIAEAVGGAKTGGKEFEGESLLIWNGHPLPLEMVKERPFTSIRDLLELAGHRIYAYSDEVEEKGRFYINSKKRD